MTRQATTSRLHLAFTVLLAAGVLVFGTLVAGGWIEVRAVERAVVESESAPLPRIRTIPRAADFFGMLGDEAHCFEFEGTWVDCWIEVEMDGETTRYGESTGEQMRIILEHGGDEPYGDPPRGYVIWVTSGSPGEETWTIGTAAVNAKGDIVTSSRTRGIPVPQPPAESDEVRSTVRSGTPDARLDHDRRIVLVSLRSLADGDGPLEERTTRVVRLLCRRAKSGPASDS